jgi:hypothetical protein
MEFAGNRAVIAFRSFPRMAATWRLVGYSLPPERDPEKSPPLFDFTITNLVRTTSKNFNAVDLPVQLDLGEVRMKINSFTAGFRSAYVDATFLENGTPVFDWVVNSARVLDLHGNFTDSQAMCCRETNVHIVGFISRIGTPTTRTQFEFVAPRTTNSKN